ncbi:hypothetical protein COCON_G00173780 [Conger conger]|uniref:Uncharacterized protein n=1 Tax=Conger conger TaxID=82655 RepID=A0A9Q1D4E2_CONCO|nr:hypothetical protein COCON_G00173780 [Conger conger]
MNGGQEQRCMIVVRTVSCYNPERDENTVDEKAAFISETEKRAFRVHTSSSLGLCWQTLCTRDRNSGELAGTVTGRLAIDYPVTVASAVASETAGMVAKDYPFYLVLKRANYALEVQTVRGNPAKEAEQACCSETVKKTAVVILTEQNSEPWLSESLLVCGLCVRGCLVTSPWGVLLLGRELGAEKEAWFLTRSE